MDPIVINDPTRRAGCFWNVYEYREDHLTRLWFNEDNSLPQGKGGPSGWAQAASEIAICANRQEGVPMPPPSPRPLPPPRPPPPPPKGAVLSPSPPGTMPPPPPQQLCLTPDCSPPTADGYYLSNVYQGCYSTHAPQSPARTNAS